MVHHHQTNVYNIKNILDDNLNSRSLVISGFGTPHQTDV